MTFFSNLRLTPWEPKFKWVATQYEAADLINRPHEDYPKRIKDTDGCINDILGIVDSTPGWGGELFHEDFWFYHKWMFSDESFAGQYRDLNVTVGPHRPPNHQEVHELMDQLLAAYKGNLNTTRDLIAWYTDFETIHPFQDGNGRVGGVIVAALSHQEEPQKGFLAPLQ